MYVRQIVLKNNDVRDLQYLLGFGSFLGHIHFLLQMCQRPMYPLDADVEFQPRAELYREKKQ